MFLARVLYIRTRGPIISALTIGVMTLLIINAMPQVNNNPKKQKNKIKEVKKREDTKLIGFYFATT